MQRSYDEMKTYQNWLRLVSKVLPESYATPVWAKWWFVALACCALSSFLGGVPQRLEWTEYIPAAAVSMGTLLALSIFAPFTGKVSLGRRAAFAIAGVWLPFLIQAALCRPLFSIRLLVEKFAGFTGFPRLPCPWASGHMVGNSVFCAISTVLVVLAAKVFGADKLSSKSGGRKRSLPPNFDSP
jgi:hypothetical protein